MTVKEHYDNHLAPVYSWMMGDFDQRCAEFQHFLIQQNIRPGTTRKAIDLGAGHGIQSIALARTGFDVLAVDFNHYLLSELTERAKGLSVSILKEDMLNVASFADRPELIVCCGDTLSHLASWNAIEVFFQRMVEVLQPGGRLILSFRDYSVALEGTARFIPVKSDDTRILTCILDYTDHYVMVTDILHQRTHEGWRQSVSSYPKVRLRKATILNALQTLNMAIESEQVHNKMVTLVALKKS
jgi:SAM-dependent methyltransferase